MSSAYPEAAAMKKGATMTTGIALSRNLLDQVKKVQAQGEKVGFHCGVFDLFHAGHVLMLKECNEHCDFLIIAVNKADHISPVINPVKKKPLFSFEQRAMIMENSRYVDAVVGYSSEEELVALLKTLQADIRFLGEDYKGRPITGGDLTKEIYYTDRSHGLSTSGYREKIQ